MRVLARACLAVMVLAGLMCPATARAGGPLELPLSGFGDIVVDDAHGQVFVSGGLSSSAIVVLDFDGDLIATIPGEAGASGMVLDGTDLWVAARNRGAIDRIDTVSHLRTGDFSVSPLSSPYFLARTGGRLWFNYGDCGSGTGGIASLDPATGTVKPYSGGAFPRNCAQVVASPVVPDRLFAWDAGQQPATIYEFSVATEPPSVVAFVTVDGRAAHGTIAPDGSALLVSRTASVAAYRVSDLAPTGVAYPTAAYGNAVDGTAGKGGFVAAGSDSPYDIDIRVYPLGDASPRLEYDIGSIEANELFTGGLALDATATKLFAVSGDAYRARPTFHVIDSPTLASSTLSLSASASSIPLGAEVTLSGMLHLAGTGVPGGKTIKLVRTSSSGTHVETMTALTSATGAFSIPHTPPASGTFDYRATWDGDADYRGAASAAVRVTVTAPDTTPPETLVLSGPAGAVNSPGSTFTFSADEASTFECALDRAAFVGCASPQTYDGLADGSHRFEVRAVDLAGNVDLSPATRTWIVDTVPPEVTIKRPRGGFVYVGGLATVPSATSGAIVVPIGAFQLSAEASDRTPPVVRFAADSTSLCEDDAPPYSCSWTPSPGEHFVEVEAEDAAGNSSFVQVDVLVI